MCPLSLRNLELIHLTGEVWYAHIIFIIGTVVQVHRSNSLKTRGRGKERIHNNGMDGHGLIDDIIYQLYRSNHWLLLQRLFPHCPRPPPFPLPLRLFAFAFLFGSWPSPGPSSSLSKIESQNCMPVRMCPCIVFLKLGSCATFPPLEPVQTVGDATDG